MDASKKAALHDYVNQLSLPAARRAAFEFEVDYNNMKDAIQLLRDDMQKVLDGRYSAPTEEECTRWKTAIDKILA